MTSKMFDLKPCHSHSTRLDWSSQLIWVDPNVLMYFQIKRRASHVLNSCISIGSHFNYEALR